MLRASQPVLQPGLAALVPRCPGGTCHARPDLSRIVRDDGCLLVITFIKAVEVPAMSSVGFAEAILSDTGEYIQICGDHRALREIGEALRTANEPIQAEIEAWQIVDRSFPQ